MIVTIGGIPVYDAIITDEETGMMRISLVDDPAVMSNFQAFDSTKKPVIYSIQDEEKRLVRGVVMRCDFPIYRRDDDMGEYYIIYKADTIRKLAEKYLSEKRQNDVDLMHQGDLVSGVQMVQYFIKGDGVSVTGFDDISDGSLFAEFHILDDNIWNEIKTGTYKGFSLEGYFDLVPEQDKDEVQTIVDVLKGAFKKLYKHNKMSKFKKLKDAILSALKEEEFGNVTTDRGVLSWDGEEDLREGDLVYVMDSEGNRTPAEDGEWKTEDNKVIVVVDGKVAEIKDAEAEVAPVPEEETKTEMGRVNTDKGELLWEGEEDLKEGDPVFVEDQDGNREVAPDGDYITEDNKTIVVSEGVVKEIRDPEAEVSPEENPEVEELRKENEDLRNQINSLQEELSRIKKMSAAKPAHEEVSTSSTTEKTGDRGLDRLSRILSAK